MDLKDLIPYQRAFDQYLETELKRFDAAGPLYSPIKYILSLPGKRIRPIMTLMSYHLFGNDFITALPQALTVETFHNFTLMHDDIMDAAPTRRGQPSAHINFGLNPAILSGDAMLILAYQYLIRDLTPAQLSAAVPMFSQVALDICQGQQEDMDFEFQQVVPIASYLDMIKKKTAILLGLSLSMGAVVAGASEESIKSLNDCGIAVGMAFQIHDDYLDAFGNPKMTGKQTGGDIINNKKTFLWLKACALGGVRVQQELISLNETQIDNPKAKIDRVLEIYRSLDLETHCIAQQHHYTTQAIDALNLVESTDEAKQRIFDLISLLLGRNH
ncbi:MAG: polyprenyl synthetase family protein [Saprospiraceae bacterium]|nr:polyprenyl synthetase family protein [Saprospiraceae bacterium]